MAKYSTEYQLKIVQEYLAEYGNYETLSKRYRVPPQEGIKAYQVFGVDGLRRSLAQQTYTFEFKRSAG